MKLIELKNHLPYTYKAIIKMFEIIGKKEDEVKNIDVSNDKNPWYEQYYWTDGQLNEFENWMYNYLWNNKGAREEIMSLPIKKKQIIDKAIPMFVLAYGFQVKEKEE